MRQISRLAARHVLYLKGLAAPLPTHYVGAAQAERAPEPAMPVPATSAELVEIVRQSGVVGEERIHHYVTSLNAAGQMPARSDELASILVRDKVLTQFQAERFLRGKWRHFIIGKYKVLEGLGAGGMCSVYLCEHRFMNRRVAIKVLPMSQAENPAALGRFYREARAVAALNHPNIVRAYDIDRDGDVHFLVMEYALGLSLQDLVKQRGPLPIGQAANYIAQAALGLQHAYEHGLIHRDIKPANLLLDNSGTIKILDLGLARFFNDESDILTREHNEAVLGTADYLSPEQALDSHTVDIRADIYSLGMTFYFLLSAQTPLGSGTVAQKLIWHQFRLPKPIRDLRPDVPEALVEVLNRMMAKDPYERFQQPAELAVALTPWVQLSVAPALAAELPAEPLTPVPDATDSDRTSWTPDFTPASTAIIVTGSANQTDRRVAPQPPKPDETSMASLQGGRRRWWIGGAVAGLAIVGLAVGLVALLLKQGAPDKSGTGRKEEKLALLSPAQARLRELTALAAAPKADAGQLRRDVFAFRKTFPGTPESVAAAQLLTQMPSPLDRFDGKGLPESVRQAWRPFELVAILGDVNCRVALGGPVKGLAFHPNGRLLATASDDKIRMLDVETLQVQAVWPDTGGYCLNFSPDGQILAGIAKAQVKLWDANSGKEKVALQNPPGDITWLRLSPDGKTLATVTKGSRMQLWDVATGKETGSFQGQGAESWALAFSPDGKVVVTGTKEHRINRWDVVGKQELPALGADKHEIWGLAFSPDGKTLVSTGWEPSARLWDVETGKPRGDLAGHERGVWPLQISPDAAVLATGSSDRTVRLWDMATAKERAVLRGSVSGIASLAFSPDGRTLASGGDDGCVWLWDVATGKPRPPSFAPPHPGNMEWVTETWDGSVLVQGTNDGVLKIWDVPSGKETARFPDCRDTCWVGLSADGKALRSVNRGSGEAKIWDTGTGKERFGAQGVRIDALSPDGTMWAAARNEELPTVCLWEAASGKLRLVLEGHTGPILKIAFAPDGKTLATASADHTVKMWDLNNGQARHTLKGHAAPVRYVTFSPDGKLLASAGDDQSGRVWDVARGKERFAFAGPDAHSFYEAFSADGKLLASGQRDGTVNVWDIETGKLQYSLAGNESTTHVGGFSADGKFLTAWADNGHVSLWRLPSVKNSVQHWKWLMPHEAYSGFAADGRHLFVYGGGTAYLLRLAPPPAIK
jgi:WD40 repeat protein/serine/threonine protein kinase